MIKLIAIDMDGTLLQGEAQAVSDEALSYIEELLDLGIIVVSASGRQYANQKRLYQHLAPRMIFICENGSLTMLDNQIWQTQSMEESDVWMIYQALLQEEGDLLISGQENCYVFDKNPAFIRFIEEVLQNQTQVIHSLEEIQEPIGKISLMTSMAQTLYEKYLPLWQDKVQVAKSHSHWLDINAKQATKGIALKALLNHLGIDPIDVMAFGDNYNDIDMLALVGVPIAMANGIDKVKALAIGETYRVEDSLRVLIHKLKRGGSQYRDE